MASGAIAARSRTRGLGSESAFASPATTVAPADPIGPGEPRRCIPNPALRWLGIESTSLVYPHVGGEQNYSGIDSLVNKKIESVL